MLLNPQNKLQMDVPEYTMSDVRQSYLATIYNELSEIYLLNMFVTERLAILIKGIPFDLTKFKGLKSIPALVKKYKLELDSSIVVDLICVSHLLLLMHENTAREDYLKKLVVTSHMFRAFSDYFFREITHHIVFTNYIFHPHKNVGKFAMVCYNRIVVRNVDIKGLSVLEEVPPAPTERAFYWNIIHDRKYLDKFHTIKWRRTNLPRSRSYNFVPYSYVTSKYRDTIMFQSPQQKIRDGLRDGTINRDEVRKFSKI